jgi:hypothetical protein
MLPFLVHKIFTFYINGVLNCKFQLQGQRVKVKKCEGVDSVHLAQNGEKWLDGQT